MTNFYSNLSFHFAYEPVIPQRVQRHLQIREATEEHILHTSGRDRLTAVGNICVNEAESLFKFAANLLKSCNPPEHYWPSFHNAHTHTHNRC